MHQWALQPLSSSQGRDLGGEGQLCCGVALDKVWEQPLWASPPGAEAALELRPFALALALVALQGCLCHDISSLAQTPTCCLG